METVLAIALKARTLFVPKGTRRFGS